MNNLFPFPALFLFLPLFSCFALTQTQGSPKPDAETGIEGVISVSPVHGGPIRQGEPESKPLPKTDFIVEQEKRTVASFQTDDQGRFRLSLPPGHYTIVGKEPRHAVNSYGPFEVNIAAGEMKKVRWDCDTGLR